MLSQLKFEFEFLKKHKFKSIAISTTAKHAVDIIVLPRRVFGDNGISSFIINDNQTLEKILIYFDGIVDIIYVDTELKQKINLYKIAKDTVKESDIIAIKPNDTTVESLDVLIREKYSDNLIDKKILIIGSGNLASKIATRLAERQAYVFIKARTITKTDKTVAAINMFLPKNGYKIDKLEDGHDLKLDIIISAISSEFTDEATIKPFINRETLLIDVGINNFRVDFIKNLLINGNEILRLDTRIALPYQMIKQNNYTQNFFTNVIGEKEVKGIIMVAGGIIGKEGSVIVDQINQPTQIIGIADGSGGVKKNETSEERKRIETITKYISAKY